jgi:hypothetical protein
MSSSIWMECAGESEIRRLELEPWRVVEAQHQVSTRKLVDSDDEQILLEQLIEGAKPARRTHGALHYLLFTPFRYPPLRYGSRFGTRAEPGIWYGSETLHTAFAEVAYYRLLFLEGTSAELGMVETSLTSFSVLLRAERGVDLTALPFSAYEAMLAAPDSYRATQSIGRAMRESGVEAARFTSARDLERGVNVAVFAPTAFGRRQPRRLQTWHCVATRWAVQVSRRDYFERGVHSFERAQFLVQGMLPAPALT